jgi:enolase-phosphatase E1
VTARIEAVVTDIEGTTSPIAFVHEVLFPYARAHLADYVKRQAQTPDVQAVFADVRALESDPALDEDAIVSLLLKWIAEDRKAKPLKTLQGMIWEEGYASGAFAPAVYDDAAAKLREWHQAGLPLYVYSSGSVPAQKLIFRHDVQGDLTTLFSGYFDTSIGGKLEKDSYDKIAAAIGKPPPSILFLSDHSGELDAARSAGFATVLVDRAGTEAPELHHRVSSFADIALGTVS